MTEYIEREAVLEITNRVSDRMLSVSLGRKVVNLPAADVVERSSFEAVGQKYAQIQDKLIRGELVPVVRCVNCVHFGSEAVAFDAFTPFCLKHMMSVLPDDFCSYGERKDGEG